MSSKQDLIAALKAVCSAWEDARERTARERNPGPLRIYSFVELTNAPIPAQAQCRLNGLAEDAELNVFRFTVYVLGEWLHDEGGIDLMHEALEEAAASQPSRYSRIAGAIDHAWEGIGGVWYA